MARTLTYCISDMFRYPGTPSYIHRFDNTVTRFAGEIKFMEIPLSGDVVEIPLCAVGKLNDMLESGEYVENTTLMVILNRNEYSSGYVSLESQLKYCFRSQASAGPQRINPRGNDTDVYYCFTGGIFNNSLHPVLMCSYLLKKADPGFYEMIKPIIRVHYSSFINQSNGMERMISKKFLTTALQCELWPSSLSKIVSQYRRRPEVIVGDIPFKILSPNTPSMNVTDDELKELALNHFDVIEQWLP